MKLVQLVSYFRNGGSFGKFCQLEGLDVESEVIEIFMEQPMEMNNDLAFFEKEKLDDKTEFNFGGKTLRQLSRHG